LKSGIILVGGQARRAGGREKYLFCYKGKTFLERLISTLQGSVDEIIIVAKDEYHCKKFMNIPGVRVVYDIRRGKGPVGGLHAGVQASHGETVFAVACDMPFVNKDVVNRLFEMAENYDAVIPCWNERMFEPLHAVYKKKALENYMKSHKSLSLREMIKSMKSCYINVEILRDIDPDLRTFTNINHLEELEKLNTGEFF
jgi:molybdopterin-guanine dinucleotide biosynthesis protein A